MQTGFWDYFSFPSQLTEHDFYETSIKIVIGENGSGKSTLLANLARRYSASNRKVIAIANTIHDKFNFTNKNFNVLKASSGKYLAKKTIINSFKNLAKKDQQTLRSTMLALGYVGFDERIGFKIVNLNPNFEKLLFQIGNLTDDDRKKIISILLRIQNEKSKRDIFWISDLRHSFEELYYSDLIQLFSFEYLLRQVRIIGRLDVFLSRQRSIIPMLHASSGELALISSIVYISTSITNNCVIMIDEPENSLHPKWQTEYVERLLDLFHYYTPQIIIATHSPLIISGAEQMESKLEIFKADNGSLKIQNNDHVNLEEIYSKYFDLTTPQNRYISEFVIEKMNELTSKEISYEKFVELILELQSNSYDDKQKKVLEDVINFGGEILNDID
ncbi:AAA family ATPase [Flavobacterium sp. F52]|uniref:AAA family ATPase n=1 Tax=Flavobacterium sp. F52 TaxID=1202532 RepID=UPI000316A4AA|nr:ATP-binding protein [Flavobacterium sp. F52]